MGLAFSHGDATWSYGGFMDARRRLAQDIGIQLDEMEGFAAGGEKWTTVVDDIVPLLAHSDCDGVLTPEQCRKVAPRLREIIADWEPGYDKLTFLELADGMDRAAEAGEDLRFT